MKIAEYFIKYSVISWVMIILLAGGGVIAYEQLGRLEDPEFTIKEAKVFTQYPGASPKEVELEVTDPIEIAIQDMAQIKRIESTSRPGFSDIKVVIKDKYTKKDLPQVWDELRRKVTDVQSKLPPGAGPSVVNDDFGDVYGMYYAIVGDGYSYAELKKYADYIKKELSLVPGVAKVVLTGQRQEVIYTDIQRSKMAKLGISPEMLANLLQTQNAVEYAGEVRVGDEYVRIQPSGAFDSAAAIGSLLIRSQNSNALVYLSDVANIYRDYEEVPQQIVYYNDKPALTMGISVVSGGNVVKIGEAVKQRMEEVSKVVPIGIDVQPIYLQPDAVSKSVNGFIVSVGEALAIVVAVLLISMGLRCGLIIGGVLMLTVLGTLLFMYFFGISLERISLGALIIALGMLVDNAIVVAEGILIKVQQGVSRLQAAKDVVGSTMWPLFGATVVGILAFAAIGLSQDSTGEYTRSLFYVILISLMLSWFLAISVTPLLCYLLLRPSSSEDNKDPYAGIIYRSYKRFLIACIRFRWLTLIVMAAMLAASIYGFAFVKQSFFPDSTTPMFYVNYWRSQGTDIRATEKDMLEISEYVRRLDGVKSVTSVIGGGAQRFMLVYSPEDSNTSYGQLLVEVNDYHDIAKLEKPVKDYILKHYPDSEPKTENIRLGPGRTAKIEARFSGPNAKVLRQLAGQAEAIMHDNPNAGDIRTDWRHREKVIEPVYSEILARSTGISRVDLSNALEMAFTGIQAGLYREDDELIPIILRHPDEERLDIANITDLQVWSPLLSNWIPVGQVVEKFDTKWEDAIVKRRNRKMTIIASTDPIEGLPSVLQRQIQDKIEAIPLPDGYTMEWGGEYEDSHDAQVALGKKLPLSFFGMFLIVILLFKSLRQPVIIWLCVPLSFIGVTAGLLITNLEFGFMALLGFLSLSGMLIKNAIVLVDQIDLSIREGQDPYEAIIDSSVSRFRPVMLAAITTVLGVIPLLFDVFFASMSVVIMFGLTFATVLTLVVVPVLYSIFFRVRSH
ncbi:MAG: hypothetical protein CMF50_00945 [Legionellales bacterium]|nr:hypothetical protein [Legionellales bacterium]|tara:strand:- start:8470 stop:11505 length:3036 start_codon:yes stop_codon:yes gene_type:complete